MKEDRIAINYFKEVGRKKQPSKKEECENLRRLLVARCSLAETEKKLESTSDAERVETLRATRNNWIKEIDRLEHAIAEGYLKFVIKQAHARTTTPQLLQDLIGAGNVGLMDTVRRYNPAFKVRFLTYADWWIRVRMQEHLSGDHTVHVPNHTRKSQRKKRREEEALIAQGQLSRHTFEEPTTTGIDPETLATDPEPFNQEGKLVSHMVDAGLTRLERLLLINLFGFYGTEQKTVDELVMYFYGVDGSCIPVESLRALRSGALARLRSHLEESGVTGVADFL